MGLPRIGITSEPLAETGRRIDGTHRELVEAVVAAGAVPVVIPVLTPGLVEASLEGIDGLLLTGGGDIEPRHYRQPATSPLDNVHPPRDEFEIPLARAALASGLPILGICRGHQVLSVALGGTLVQHVPAHEELDLPDREVHEVRIAPGSLLAAVMGVTELGVNSLHHQAVELAGAGLQVVGRSADGTVEAVEGLGDLRVIGVQWQPELLLDRPVHAALFDWLAREAMVTPLIDLTEPVAAAEIGPIPAGRSGRAVA